MQYIKKYHILLLWLLCGVCIAFFMVGVVQNVQVYWRQVYLQDTAQVDGQVQNNVRNASVEENSVGVEGVLYSNLFGKVSAKKAPVQQIKNIPKTTLNLVLEGVFSAEDERYARALIRINRNKTQIVSIGEDIKGVNATLLEVYPSEVILSRNGAREKLTLPRKKLPVDTKRGTGSNDGNRNVRNADLSNPVELPHGSGGGK